MARIRRGLKASIVALAILLLVIMLALTLLGTVAAGLTIIVINVLTGQASAWNPTDALVGTGRVILVGLIICLFMAGLAWLYSFREIMEGSRIIASVTGSFYTGYQGSRLACYGAAVFLGGSLLSVAVIGIPVMLAGLVMVSIGTMIWGLSIALLGVRLGTVLCVPGLLVAAGSMLTLLPSGTAIGLLLWLIGGYTLHEHLTHAAYGD